MSDDHEEPVSVLQARLDGMTSEEKDAEIRSLIAEMSAAIKKARKLDHTIDGMVALIASARLRAASISAVIHLQKFVPEVLASESLGHIDNMLRNVCDDLAQAETKADRIPF